MKTFYIAIFLFIVTLFAGALLALPKNVSANAVCDGASPACVMEWIPWTHIIQSCDPPDQYGNKQCYPVQVTDWVERCTIPQAGGGSCKCCFEDGCYLDCPGIKPTGGGGGDGGGGGGGGGGSTPVPTSTPAPGTITAVARAVSTDQSCTAVSNSTDPITGTTFGFGAGSASTPAPKTQTDNNPVTFATMPVGNYTLSYTLPSPDWTLTTPCIYQNGVLIAYGQSATLAGGATLDWRFGFTRGSAWAQTQGGDVYAASTLRSYIPSAATPRVFNRDTADGYPGVVIYGATYDFDNTWSQTGSTYISSKNWVVNATHPQTDYYDFFYRRYGSPTTPTTDPAFSNPLAVTKPPGSATPYYVVGDITTSGNWSVGTNESIVILVDGNTTIGGNWKFIY